MPDLETLKRELEAARQEVKNLTVMGMRPDLSSEKVEVIRHLERSARAEVKLRTRALQHFKEEQEKQAQ